MRALTPCKHMISGTISLRSQRFFSPFPRGTCSLSVANEYLALRRGRRGFTRSFTCDRVTQEFPRRAWVFGYGPFTLSGAIFHSLHLTLTLPRSGSYNPESKLPGLGCSAFARRYLRNRIRFLFLRLLRCFTSPGIACSDAMNSHRRRSEYYPERVTPFGNPRVKAYLPLIRGLSQLITSFFAYWHQGIHHVLLVA